MLGFMTFSSIFSTPVLNVYIPITVRKLEHVTADYQTAFIDIKLRYSTQ